MGAFTEVIKMMLRDNNIEDERTLRAIEDEGKAEADKIAEELGQKEDRTAFVPKVPPVNLPKDFETNKSGKKIEKEDAKKEDKQEENERDD